MHLCEGETGKAYQVAELEIAPQITRRLEALGVNEGTKIEILNHKRNRGAFIIRVRGTRLAIGRRIADGITIKEVPEDGK